MAFFSRTIILSVILILGLSACSANHNSIFRQNDLTVGRSNITLLDAKQREIISSVHREIEYQSDGTTVSKTKVRRRFCSAPSPDFVSVMAQSLSAGASFGKSGSPAAIEAAFKGAYSSSEQGSTIARTQTINMLRELMFRTCERYLSGGIDDLELSVQAIRDQRLMVSILAIEQLTGAVTPKPITIGASGSAGAGFSDQAIVSLDAALKAKESAEDAYEKAAAAKKLNFEGDGKCVEKKATEGKPETAKPTEADKPICKGIEDNLKSATELQTNKRDHYADLKRLAGGGTFLAQTVLRSSAPGGIDQANVTNIENVASAVQYIVTKNFSDDSETMMFCLRSLHPKTTSKIPTTLRKMCEGYFQVRVASSISKLDPNANYLAKIMPIIQRGYTQSAARADAFWDSINLNADPLKIDSSIIAKAVNAPYRILDPKKTNFVRCLAAVVDEKTAKSCFKPLNATQQREVIDVIGGF